MTEQQYRDKLQHHDWYYNYSDDASVWRKGFEADKELQAAQKSLDPDYKIWNEYCPQEWRRK